PSTDSVRWTVASWRQRWQVMGRSAGDGRAGSTRRVLLEVSDLVAEPGRILVVLGGHGPFQLVAQLDQLGLALAVAGSPPGDLAAVANLLVDVLQQRHQLVAEDLVVVRTPQPAGVAEFSERGAAHRAGPLVGRRGLAPLAAGRLDQTGGQLADGGAGR